MATNHSKSNNRKTSSDGLSADSDSDVISDRSAPTTTDRLKLFRYTKEGAQRKSPDEIQLPYPNPIPKPLSEIFPELHPARKYVQQWIEQGMTADMIWTCVSGLLKIDVTQQRVAAYVERLFDELFPLGPIQRRLFEIKPAERTWQDDDTLFSFGEEPNEDIWTISDVCKGTLILGAPGSGKTSGSARRMAIDFLKNNFGGVVFTAKDGEAQNWINQCTAMGRGNDIAVIKCGGPLRLNFLQYEAERPGMGAEMTSNIVAFFQVLLSALGGSRGQGRHENGDFWRQAGDQLLTNLIETFLISKTPVTLDALCEFIAAAPMSSDEVEGWQDRGIFGSCLKEADDQAMSVADRRMLAKLKDYWLNIYPNLAEETRSCVTVGFTAMADVLRGRHIYDLVSTHTSCTPEMVMAGKIVIIDLPLGEFRDAGLLVQLAWKHLLQRALLRRTDTGDERRPVFMWEEEGHNFLIDHDNEFQAVSREFRVARVLISQNLNNFYAKFGGGDAARVKVDSLIANIGTRIFHANSDIVTNEWASKSLGTMMQRRIEKTKMPPESSSHNPLMNWLEKRSRGSKVQVSERFQREARVQPHEFQELQVGSSRNGWVTQAIITQAGRRFAGTDRSFELVSFHQTKIPEIKFSQDSNQQQK